MEKRNTASRQDTCQKCGYTHAYRNCPAYNKVCSYCKNTYHFARVCKNKKHQVSVVQGNNEENVPTYFLGNIEIGTVEEEPWYERVKFVKINKALMFKLDSGAGCNVMAYSHICKLGIGTKINPTSAELRNYGGSRLNTLGTVQLLCEIRGRTQEIMFHVVEKGSSPLIGLTLIKKLGLLVKIHEVSAGPVVKNNDSIIDEFKDVFEGKLGVIKGYKYKFKLKSGYQGKIEPCRNVPFKVYHTYKKELDKLEELDILEKIDEPTQFENAVVLVKKPDGSLRICLDPKNLNDCLMREHFKLPTFEEIRARMKSPKVFTVLDASKAFHQVELDEDSSKITTFQTPFGRYRYKRMPYGIKTAPEIFHKKFKEIFGNINNIEHFMDDLKVWGKDQYEHDKTLRQVLERAREYNVKLNKTKCKIGVNKVKFLGHIFTDQGIEVNKEKVEAIMKMERPENVKEMERFLGIVNYISKFISMASSVTAPLREMIKENRQWVWTKEREQAYEEVKIKLTTTPVQQYYDPNMDCKLSVDASGTGVGAVLLQNELPVAYASKALTDAQKAWAQIEKELYAIVFGCERFHQYIYGKKILIESDHKPLTLF